MKSALAATFVFVLMMTPGAGAQLRADDLEDNLIILHKVTDGIASACQDIPGIGNSISGLIKTGGDILLPSELDRFRREMKEHNTEIMSAVAKIDSDMTKVLKTIGDIEEAVLVQAEEKLYVDIRTLQKKLTESPPKSTDELKSYQDALNLKIIEAGVMLEVRKRGVIYSIALNSAAVTLLQLCESDAILAAEQKRKINPAFYTEKAKQIQSHLKASVKNFRGQSYEDCAADYQKCVKEIVAHCTGRGLTPAIQKGASAVTFGYAGEEKVILRYDTVINVRKLERTKVPVYGSQAFSRCYALDRPVMSEVGGVAIYRPLQKADCKDVSTSRTIYNCGKLDCTWEEYRDQALNEYNALAKKAEAVSCRYTMFQSLLKWSEHSQQALAKLSAVLGVSSGELDRGK